MFSQESSPRYRLCVDNVAYSTSLEQRKVYQALPDPVAAQRGFVRVVDESGKDYLYPTRYFVAVNLPQAAASIFSGRS